VVSFNKVEMRFKEIGKAIAVILLVVACRQVSAQHTIGLPVEYTQTVNGHSIFKVDKPDYTKSPYIGVTRNHWKEAAMHLLYGTFS